MMEKILLIYKDLAKSASIQEAAVTMRKKFKVTSFSDHNKALDFLEKSDEKFDYILSDYYAPDDKAMHECLSAYNTLLVNFSVMNKNRLPNLFSIILISYF